MPQDADNIGYKPTTMKVTFNINFHTEWGQKLCIVGSVPELGSWNTAHAKEMSYVGGGNWQLELDIQGGVGIIEYKYLLSVNEQRIFEEWERNHWLELNASTSSYILYDFWQVRPENMAFYSSAFTKGLFCHEPFHGSCSVKSGKRLIIRVNAPRVEKDQCVAISGNQDVFGNWSPDMALMLNSARSPEWYIEMDASSIRYPLEYKFIVCDRKSKKPLYWESGDNRVLSMVPQKEHETVVLSGLFFRENLPDWRCAGSVIPVFSLRSEKSFGVGDLGDLRLMVDWAKRTGQKIIQVLPMNDTTVTHSWVDSYPYSAISIYALHPMYISLPLLGELKDKKKAALYEARRIQLNSMSSVDYDSVMNYKVAYCNAYFLQEKNNIIESEDFKLFVSYNEEWLLPYAAYSFFRDYYGTSNFSKWESYAHFNIHAIRSLCSKDKQAWENIQFYYFLQYVLHTQFKSVSNYARANGVVLKGDLPIGVSRTSVEVWTEPKYFNMNGQAGAPPDDFSVNGQNWLFPTYNWDVMESDGFSWWRRRFAKLGDYFDCFRIDHILGFFRIWEVPCDYVQGLCGHFNPALPFSIEEIEQYGLRFNETRFTTPHINRCFLHELFGDYTDEVLMTYLAQSSLNHYVLKPFCDTQRKIESLFARKEDRKSLRIKNGLFAVANEVLFLRDTREKDKFHPRISANTSYIYRELSDHDRSSFDQLYWHFFYHRHNDFWKGRAYKRLTPLVASTDMLVCGEDLGMIPASVPEVMNRLQIFSLEIERMPKDPNREFTDMFNLPYHSVCTTSTHDMTPLRNWWKEDTEKTQRYYNNVLMRLGKAPAECSADIASQIVSNHLKTKSMLVIIPMQDWFAMDDSIKRKDIESERINVPANSRHYWRYRMHITLESLLAADQFNDRIADMIKESGRR